MSRFFLTLTAAGILAAAPLTADDKAADPFGAKCAALAAATDDFALAGGVKPWLFLRSELEHLAKGEFWKSPLPCTASMQAFAAQLKEKGVRLLVVPVPAKAAIHPDKLDPAAKPDAVRPLAPFVAALTSAGLTVLDLDAAYRKAAATPGAAPLYCATDAHWSPAGIALAADTIAAALRADPDTAPLVAGSGPAAASGTLKIKGDLTAAESLRRTPEESLPVTWPLGTPGKGAPADPAAAIMLLGDSHTMVFTDGAAMGMHCEGAGLREHLQARLGSPLAQVSNQNSGGDGARRILRQRELAKPDFWQGRKLVIWVFSERECTAGKWR